MKRYFTVVVIGFVYAVFIVSFAVAENLGVFGNNGTHSVISGNTGHQIPFDRLITHNGDPSPYPPLPPSDTGMKWEGLKQQNGDPSPYPPLPPSDTGMKWEGLKQHNGDPSPYPPLPPSDTGIN